jgi:hypothetical protein
MRDADDRALAEADFVLSILPPGEAVALAERLVPALTAASALKMSYAGITKGLTALGATMMLAATRGGSGEALRAELADSQRELLTYFERAVPGMYGKAYRWVAELYEIAAFVGSDRPESEMLSAAARLYENIAADVAGEKRETAVLDRFLKR